MRNLTNWLLLANLIALLFIASGVWKLDGRLDDIQVNTGSTAWATQMLEKRGR